MSSKKSTKLKDTGERMIPEFHTGNFMFGEHIVRYESALEFVNDKTILDIACGSGYGSNILSKTARKVYGVDIDQATIKYAQENFNASNIEFKVGSAVSIPLENSSVDRVITFETVEHIEDYEKFILEIKRVLKDDGLAIISTPNDLEFSEGNHFHLHEFEHKEFLDLLNKNFKFVDIYFQGAWICNGLFKENQLTKNWTEKIKVLNLAPKEADKAIYFFAVVSDTKINTSIEPIVGISDHWSQRAIEEENAKTVVHNRNMNALVTLEKEKSAALEKEKDALLSEIKQIKSSRSWKLAQKISRSRKIIRPKK